MDKYYTANIFLIVIAMAIMMAAVNFNVVLDRMRKRVTIALFGAIIVAALCEWTGNLLNGAPVELISFHKAVKTVELSLTPFIGILCGRSLSNDDTLERVSFLVAFGNLILEVLSAFNGMIFFVDGANFYHHARFYGIYTFVCLICILGFFLRGVQAFHRYQASGGVLIGLVTLFLTGGIIVQMVDPHLNITWLSVGISSIMLYKFYSDIIQQVDGLTELINRWGYENYLSHFNGQGAILYFDVDHFKTINDTYGHSYGDSCLRTIADNIRAAYASSGKCFRIGGDEFCVILDRNLEQIDAMNRDFLWRVRNRRKADPHLPKVSIGYVRFDTNEININDAVAVADTQMYAAKQRAHQTEKSLDAAPALKKS